MDRIEEVVEVEGAPQEGLPVWTPTPRVIDGDGKRSHWAKRDERVRRVRAKAGRNRKWAWLTTAPAPTDMEDTDEWM
jgi:hypothetical protein